MNKINKICCIGAGYVGGPTMAVIAKHCPHIEINVIDTNKNRIEEWNNKDLSKLPIYEPGLDQIIHECKGRNLHFSCDIEKNIAEADMIFISVNTPTKKRGLGAGQASDLKWVEASARQISKFSRGETIVVEKSTLPVKTAQTIKEILLNESNKLSNKNFSVLSNPEFLAEGTAINDLENPDRVLIGGENEDSINALIDIYENWVPRNKILTTNLWSSELSKLIANAFLAQRVSSINSISALCEITGADISEVALAVGSDKRIGEKFLQSGPGFGGSCFKKDILNLIYICNHYGLFEVSAYWQKVIDINSWQQKRISEIIVNKLFGTVSDKKICILGFAFKANTNDTRQSPAISICNDLLEEGANLFIYDPKVSEKQIKLDLASDKNYSNNERGSWQFTKNIDESVEEADAIVILTEWDEFKYLDWGKISILMRSPAWVFDTRSICNLKEAIKHKMHTWSLGNGLNF